eukprot:scaffold1307_cov106-Isochrysis_galbana.AAC.4
MAAGAFARLGLRLFCLLLVPGAKECPQAPQDDAGREMPERKGVGWLTARAGRPGLGGREREIKYPTLTKFRVDSPLFTRPIDKTEVGSSARSLSLSLSLAGSCHECRGQRGGGR